MKEENIGVLAQREYLNNGLQTFEKNINQYLLDQDYSEPIYHNYRGSSNLSYPFSRTFNIYRTGRKLKKEADKFDKIFIPSQSRLIFDPEEVDAQIIPYIHDILPYTSAHTVGTEKGINKIVQGFNELLFQDSYIDNIEKLDKVIVASDQTARDLRHRTNFDGEIEVVYQGVDDMPEIESVSSEDRYIDLIYIGTLHERKNPEFTRKVFEKAKERGYNVASINYEEIDLPGKTYVDVSDKKMAELLSSSRYYIHSSDIEGFGRTPVEAQRYGCYPIGFNTQINNEILGNKYIKTSTITGVLNTLKRKLTTSQRASLNRYSKKYSWDKTKSQIEEVLIQ